MSRIRGGVVASLQRLLEMNRAISLPADNAMYKIHGRARLTLRRILEDISAAHAGEFGCHPDKSGLSVV